MAMVGSMFVRGQSIMSNTPPVLAVQVCNRDHVVRFHHGASEAMGLSDKLRLDTTLEEIAPSWRGE